jgi:hypothetical protein
MGDAEFVAELALAFLEGTVSSSDAKLSSIYRRFDGEFESAGHFEDAIEKILTCIAIDLSQVRHSFIVKPYVFHSLCCALYHLRYGLVGFEEKTGIEPIGSFLGCASDVATNNLIALAAAHEGKDMSQYPDYVDACLAGANREKQRTARVRYLCLALQNKL